jgi:hypothetical protein
MYKLGSYFVDSRFSSETAVTIDLLSLDQGLPILDILGIESLDWINSITLRYLVSQAKDISIPLRRQNIMTQ